MLRSGPPCGCQGPAHLPPGGSGLGDSLVAYGAALQHLFDTDPVRGIALVVGGAPGAVVTAFVEHRGNVSASVRQSACDLSLVYAAAAVIIPSVATLALGPIGLVAGGTYGALCALIAAICSYLCNGTPIPGSVVTNAAAASASLAGAPLSSSDVAALGAALPHSGGSSMATAPLSPENQALQAGVATFLHLAATPSVPIDVVKSTSYTAATETAKSLGLTSHYVALRMLTLFADWNKAHYPRTFEAVVLIARHRFLQSWITTAVQQAAAALNQHVPVSVTLKAPPTTTTIAPGIAPGFTPKAPPMINVGLVGNVSQAPLAPPAAEPPKSGGLALPAIAAAILYGFLR